MAPAPRQRPSAWHRPLRRAGMASPTGGRVGLEAARRRGGGRDACTNSASGRSTSTSPPRTRVWPSCASISLSGLVSFSAKRPNCACHCVRAAASASATGTADVVGVGRELEREVERLPARRDTRRRELSTSPPSRARNASRVRGDVVRQVASSSGVATPSKSRMPSSFAVARSVTPLRAHRRRGTRHRAVEAGPVVVLARGQVREHVAHGPPVAARRLSPGRVVERADEVAIEAIRLASPSGRTDRGRPDPDRPSRGSPHLDRSAVTCVM